MRSEDGGGIDESERESLLVRMLGVITEFGKGRGGHAMNGGRVAIGDKELIIEMAVSLIC